MTTFLITIAVFALALLGMGIGALVNNRCLRGSCGGLANLKDEQGRPLCEACRHADPEAADQDPAPAEQYAASGEWDAS